MANIINPDNSAIEEVAANIYKIRLPMPFEPHHINVYLLRENNRLALVDTGLPMAFADLEKGFRHLGLPFSEVTDILLTHYHIDHTGALAQLREAAPGARVYFHHLDHEFMSTRHKHREKTLAYMTDWLKASGADDLTADAGFSFSLSMIPFYESDKLVSGGEEFRLTDEGDGWEIVWTPGHTNGHFVLYNRQRQLLLSGDHLLTTISSNIGKFPGSRQDPLGDFINSLDLLAGLEIETVLPAHGHSFGNHRHRIEKLKEHHRHRMNKILSSLEHGPRTASQVAHFIWGDRLKGFNRYLGLMEVSSHLERLRQEGQVVTEERDDVVYHGVV